MNDDKYELYLLFSFILKNINFPLNIEKTQTINKSIINDKNNEHLEIQCGEHWEDLSVTRRSIWLFSPHIHYSCSLKNDKILREFFKEQIVTYPEVKISTVFGGVSLIQLKMIISGEFDAIIDSVNLLTGKKIGIDKNRNPICIENAGKLNKFFSEIIIRYTAILNKIDSLKFNNEKIKWSEYSDNNDFDYFAGITKEGYCTFSSGKEIFYQEPYIILISEREIRENEVDNFFGYCIKGINSCLNRSEIKVQDIFSIWVDPVKTLIEFKKNEDIRFEILQVIQRVLFLLKTKSHFCMLWDSKLQMLYKKLHEILRDIRKPDVNYTQKIKDITNISLILAECSSEIFSSFIWRYSALLSSSKGYLTTIYKEFNAVMTTQVKSKDLKNSIGEMRKLLEFIGNILRDKAATCFVEKFEN